MEPILEKKGVFSPQLGLAIASFAAFLGIMTMNRLSALAIDAVNDFSIGIPFIFTCLFLQVLAELPQSYQLTINTIKFIFVLIGTFFCLLGLYNCFALVSEKAAVNFAVFGVIIFMLLLATGIHELIIKDKKESKKGALV